MTIDTVRWWCVGCEHETTRERPESREKLSHQSEGTSCPQCGSGQEFQPYPFLMTLRFKAIEDSGVHEFQTISEEEVVSALTGQEVGTGSVSNDDLVSISPDEGEAVCVCDYCHDEIRAGTYVTGYAFAHPGAEDEDGWVFHEVYCPSCDISEPIIGSIYTEDVVVHGQISARDDAYAFTDVAELHREPRGTRIKY